MSRLLSLDLKFTGTVGHSIEHLPQWYQVIALAGVFFVIYLRDNAVISWLVANLHNSFGTENIWHEEYVVLLEHMTFNERLFFTLYGVVLLIAIAALYKICCQDTYTIGWSVTQLFPDKKGCTAVVWVLMCVVEALRLREESSELLNRPDSLAHIALHGFKDLSESSYDQRLADSNAHFVIQAEVMKMYLGNMVYKRILCFAAAGAFRLFCDVPRRTHAALRWYFVTVAIFLGIQEIVHMYVADKWRSAPSWALVGWVLVLTSTVNFIYGPTKRAGMVVTVSRSNSITEAVRGLTTCAAMWAIAALAVVTVVMGMHVVELFLVWVLITLIILWVPTVIDACSIDYITLLSAGCAYIGYHMGRLTLIGSLRFGILLAVWWFTLSLVYNVTTNFTRTRYGGVGVAAWFFLWLISSASDQILLGTKEAADGVSDIRASTATGILNARLQWMCDVSNDGVELPLQPFSEEVAASLYSGQFGHSLKIALCLSAFLVLVASMVGRMQGTEVKARLRRSAIPLVSPSTLFYKCVRTMALMTCIIPALFAYFSFRDYVLPHIVMFLPSLMSQGISAVVACTVLGMLMDMKESITDVVMRLLGASDPPAVNEEEDALTSDDEAHVPRTGL